jgi:hypothetical protein
MPRRRRPISEREQARRERQRQQPRPSYSELYGPPSVSEVQDLDGPRSAGARSPLLRARPPPPVTPIAPTLPTLLYTRRQASTMLNVSISTLLRLEASGQLRGIKLTKGTANAMVYYPAADLIALASGR